MTNTRHTLAIAAVTILTAGALAAQKPQALLKSAIDKEMADGDLKGAIALYERTVTEARTDRATAAQALLRMGECHEKLGDGEARKIFERVVKEFSDQKDAASRAKARLNAGRPAARPGEMALRKVFSGGFKGGISRDGRYLSYQRSPETGGPPLLRVRDLSTGEDWAVTGRGSGPIQVVLRSVVSADGAQAAYQSCESPTRCQVRISKLRNDGVSYRLLHRSQEGEAFEPMDWSPDGNWIAGIVTRADHTAQIGKLSVKDGALTVLKSLEWRGTSRAFFSPDSKFLAYDMPASQGEKQRDVFLLAVDGSRESAAVKHAANDIVMGWSPDGYHLLFASDRDGAMGLWAVAVADGKPNGSPQLVKSHIGNAESMGITSKGTLHLTHLGETSEIEAASVDLATGKTLAPPHRPILTHVGTNGTPAWSRDGKYLAYVSRRGVDEGPILCVRDNVTGTVREIPAQTGFQYLTAISWAPDGNSLAAFAADLKGREGVYRIDITDGRVQLAVPGRTWNLGFSPDGGRLYYQTGGDIFHGELLTVIGRELLSGTEREVAKGAFGAVTISPDGRWIAAVEASGSGRARTTLVVPIAGGSPRKLLGVTDPFWFNGPSMTWTPDSRGLLVRKMLTAGGERSELWHVPIEGETPRKLDLDGSPIRLWVAGQIRLHPDGRQIAYVVGGVENQIWALENFLAAMKGRP